MIDHDGMMYKMNWRGKIGSWVGYKWDLVCKGGIHNGCEAGFVYPIPVLSKTPSLDIYMFVCIMLQQAIDIDISLEVAYASRTLAAWYIEA